MTLVLECIEHFGVSNVMVVLHRHGLLAERCQDIEGLCVLKVSNQLQGHFSLPRSFALLHAHDARAVHFCWISHLLCGKQYIITRRVQDPLKNKWLTRQTYGRAASIVSISKCIQGHLKEHSFSSDVIPSAIYPTDVPVRCEKGLSQTINLLHLGALVDQHKGQSVAIKALSKLPHHYRLTFVGDGPDYSHLRNLAHNLGLGERVDFLPWDDAYLRTFSAKIDLFIFPSNHEGLGSVLLDVMQHGIPIVASDVGGIPDLIQHEVTGLLAKAGDASSFAYQISRLIHNVKLRKRVVEQARKRVRDYEPRVMLKSYEAIYQRIIK